MMRDEFMRDAWHNAATNARKWELFRLMTPAQKRELVDLPNRDPVLHPHFDSQERVVITTKEGQQVRGYIGRSTGWMPVYLLLKRRDSIGGSPISVDDIGSIRGLGVYR